MSESREGSPVNELEDTEDNINPALENPDFKLSQYYRRFEITKNGFRRFIQNRDINIVPPEKQERVRELLER